MERFSLGPIRPSVKNLAKSGALSHALPPCGLNQKNIKKTLTDDGRMMNTHIIISNIALLFFIICSCTTFSLFTIRSKYLVTDNQTLFMKSQVIIQNDARSSPCKFTLPVTSEFFRMTLFQNLSLKL